MQIKSQPIPRIINPSGCRGYTNFREEKKGGERGGRNKLAASGDVWYSADTRRSRLRSKSDSTFLRYTRKEDDARWRRYCRGNNYGKYIFREVPHADRTSGFVAPREQAYRTFVIEIYFFFSVSLLVFFFSVRTRLDERVEDALPKSIYEAFELVHVHLYTAVLKDIEAIFIYQIQVINSPFHKNINKSII